MKAIIYARTSTDKDEQKTSIPEQEYTCREYAEKNGLDVVAVYTDEASGKNMDRPGLERALGALALGKAEVILVKDQSRLTRETADLLRLRDFARAQGWKIHTLKGELDFYDPNVEFMATLETALDTRERAAAKKKICQALNNKKARGEKLGGTRPFGYDIEVKEGKKILVENKKEQKAIALINELRGNELTLAAICKELKRRKIKNVSGNTTWNQMSVKRIIDKARSK